MKLRTALKTLSAALAFAVVSNGVAAAHDDHSDAGARDAEIRAAMIVNFARYAEWFEEGPDEDKLSICATAASDVEHALRAIEGREIDGQILAILPVSETPPAQCDLAYVEGEDASASAVAQLAAHSVLTVSRDRGFAEHGVIELVQVGRQTRFKANNSNASASGIRLSSRLLRLAVEVQ